MAAFFLNSVTFSAASTSVISLSSIVFSSHMRYLTIAIPSFIWQLSRFFSSSLFFFAFISFVGILFLYFCEFLGSELTSHIFVVLGEYQILLLFLIWDRSYSISV